MFGACSSNIMLLCELKIVGFNINQLLNRALAETVPLLGVNEPKGWKISLRSSRRSHQTEYPSRKDLKGRPRIATRHPELERADGIRHQHLIWSAVLVSHLKRCDSEIGVFSEHSLLGLGCRMPRRMIVNDILNFQSLMRSHVNTQVTWV
jgi:hypothetical protein